MSLLLDEVECNGPYLLLSGYSTNEVLDRVTSTVYEERTKSGKRKTGERRWFDEEVLTPVKS